MSMLRSLALGAALIGTSPMVHAQDAASRDCAYERASLILEAQNKLQAATRRAEDAAYELSELYLELSNMRKDISALQKDSEQAENVWKVAQSKYLTAFKKTARAIFDSGGELHYGDGSPRASIPGFEGEMSILDDLRAEELQARNARLRLTSELASVRQAMISPLIRIENLKPAQLRAEREMAVAQRALIDLSTQNGCDDSLIQAYLDRLKDNTPEVEDVPDDYWDNVDTEPSLFDDANGGLNPEAIEDLTPRVEFYDDSRDKAREAAAFIQDLLETDFAAIGEAATASNPAEDGTFLLPEEMLEEAIKAFEGTRVPSESSGNSATDLPLSGLEPITLPDFDGALLDSGIIDNDDSLFPAIPLTPPQTSVVDAILDGIPRVPLGIGDLGPEQSNGLSPTAPALSQVSHDNCAYENAMRIYSTEQAVKAARKRVVDATVEIDELELDLFYKRTDVAKLQKDADEAYDVAARAYANYRTAFENVKNAVAKGGGEIVYQGGKVRSSAPGFEADMALLNRLKSEESRAREVENQRLIMLYVAKSDVENLKTRLDLVVLQLLDAERSVAALEKALAEAIAQPDCTEGPINAYLDRLRENAPEIEDFPDDFWEDLGLEPSLFDGTTGGLNPAMLGTDQARQEFYDSYRGEASEPGAALPESDATTRLNETRELLDSLRPLSPVGPGSEGVLPMPTFE